MVISEVEGQFHNYEGTIVSDGEDFTNAKINISIDVNSIDTDNEKRDTHLKSDDFFNAEKFPQIKFVSKSMTKIDDKNYKVVGDFTMRDVTKEIELNARLNGFVKDPWGNTRVGFKLSGGINRFDYNLKWSNTLETGGLIAGKDVELVINIELIKK
jgi:polyisoprenoid-binding protein YceI